MFQCFNPGCIDTTAVLSKEQQNLNYCQHIGPAREARIEKRYAPISHVNVQALAKKISDDEIESMLTKHSIEGEIAVYVLPGENLVVPHVYEEEAYVHIR